MIREKNSSDGRIIDLTGPQGNAFCLMGIARDTARQMGIDHEPIIEDMMSGEYEHLLEVFEKHFGTIYTLIR